MLVGVDEKKPRSLESARSPVLGEPVMGLLRGLEDGSIKLMWTQVVNIFQSTPNSNHWLKAARKPENFVVGADAYPTLSAKVADLSLPVAMIFEKWAFTARPKAARGGGIRWCCPRVKPEATSG
ncbi:MAG: hypothetical protein V8R49_02525 [Duodenibacillus massiliensis]